MNQLRRVGLAQRAIAQIVYSLAVAIYITFALKVKITGQALYINNRLQVRLIVKFQQDEVAIRGGVRTSSERNDRTSA